MRLGLVPSLIGSGIALEQSPDPGSAVMRGSRLTVRFGKITAQKSPSPRSGSSPQGQTENDERNAN
jgi:beta-lactam-binding protein with PASTA domain